MGQVTKGPVDYPHEKEKKEAEEAPTPEPKEEPSHEGVGNAPE
jgi:hypothetical protein